MNDLKQAAHTALTICMGLKSGESLLVITDDNKKIIGEALYMAGREITSDVLLVVMPPAEINGQEPRQSVAELMKSYNAVICPTTKSITHTDARRNACAAGARVATMPGITKDIMSRTLYADYNEIAKRTFRLTEILDKGKLAKIVTEAGTDLELPINDIKAISSTGLILNPGQGGNLPSGESFMMPEEGKSQGKLVIDASVASIGKIKGRPVEVEIKDGYAVEFKGGPQAKRLKKLLESFGKPGLNVAELGIGTNHAARISGQILEDEKVMGTIHIAFGNNISMGGTCNVGIHIDGVVLEPTVYIDGRKIIDKGRFLV
ncbi:MAG: aminopeptidase [Calditrichaceae bacterium]|nr:aminopeptidase [Calditrichaceae bacterium]MBN2707887.1 aminopeptidase [Calditrichaceae bacterium]RQV97835.1 MAG: aminopeptidase [Calditrichota bacterium]